MKTKLDKKGYVLIHCPNHKYSKTKNGWILEHRKVVEDYIGRALKRGECIHHINFIKWDNSLKNLMVFKSHKAHASFHNKIKQIGYCTQPMKFQIANRWEEFK